MNEVEKNELKFAVSEMMQINVRGGDVIHLSNAIVSVSGVLNRQDAEEEKSGASAEKQEKSEKKQK